MSGITILLMKYSLSYHQSSLYFVADNYRYFASKVWLHGLLEQLPLR